MVGGAGFVGSNLVLALLEAQVASVIVVDNLLSADRSNVPVDPRVTLVDKSINDDEVLAGIPEDLDYAFHLATYHGNQNSMADPLADHEHNTLTSLKLFQRLSQLNGLRKVVYASAGCTVAQKTFDAAEATTEDDPVSLHLDSPYQISKIIGEFYGNYFFRSADMPFVKARFQNVYGPREILGAGEWRGTVSTIWRNVTPTFIYKALDGQALPVDNGGIATRDFIYVSDLVEGLLLCATSGRAGEVYNLASGVETYIMDLAEMVNKLTDNETPIDFKPARTWDRSGKRYGATDKARSEIGFAAHTSLEEGLRRTVEWTRQNMSTIQRCIAQHESRLTTL